MISASILCGQFNLFILFLFGMLVLLNLTKRKEANLADIFLFYAILLVRRSCGELS